MNDREIGEALGFPKYIIRDYRNKLSLPPNYNKNVPLTEEEKEKIVELYNQDPIISFRVIAEEVERSYPTVIEFCREQGLDTSKKRGFNRKLEKLIIFLEENGPTPQTVLKEKLKIGNQQFPKIAREMFDKVERFNFKRGQGKRVHLVADIYGELLNMRNVFCLRGDERIIDFVAKYVPFRPKTTHEVASLTQHLGNQLGYERARRVAEKLGHQYAKPSHRELPKQSRQKFTNKELIKYYNEELNDREIADILGVSRAAVNYRRNILGLPPHSKSGRKKARKLVQCPHCGKEFKL